MHKGYDGAVDLFFAVVGVMLVAMLVIESIQNDYKKAIGGMILIGALLFGCVPEH